MKFNTKMKKDKGSLAKKYRLINAEKTDADANSIDYRYFRPMLNTSLAELQIYEITPQFSFLYV